MRYIIMALTVGLGGFAAVAAFTQNPDSNTLWLADGRDIRVGPGASAEHWREGELEIASGPGGTGFVTVYLYHSTVTFERMTLITRS